jgi:transcription antitermination factor NusG
VSSNVRGSMNAVEFKWVEEMDAAPWLVLRTRSRHESVVESVLEQRGVSAYLPRQTLTRRSKQKRGQTSLPLFSGYIFVRPRVDQYEGMRYIRGSCGFVLAAGRPASLPEEEVMAVKKLVDSGLDLTIEPNLVPGRRVNIVSGPFAGVQGELIHLKNQASLVVNVQLVGSSVRVEVDREAIELL